MNRIDDIIAELKQERNPLMDKEAAEKTPVPTDVSLDDLELQIQRNIPVSEGLQKIAGALDNVSNVEDLVKIAEEANNTDIANLTKIADTIGDMIADRVISRINTKG